jgi:putative membrane protein
VDPDPRNDSEKILRRLHVSEHLANERTHLAYIRTAVSVIGLGIAINRFSLYLVQSQKVPAKPRWILEDAEDFRPNMVLVWILTAAVLALGAASLAWVFQR